MQSIGKGFGYVNFESPDSVELALENDDFTIRNRKAVLKRYSSNVSKKEHSAKVLIK